MHKDGVIKITVEHMDGPLPPPPAAGVRKGDDAANEVDSLSDDTDSPIATWTYCKQCNKVVTPLVYISENTWKFSFGKFLEGEIMKKMSRYPIGSIDHPHMNNSFLLCFY